MEEVKTGMTGEIMTPIEASEGTPVAINSEEYRVAEIIVNSPGKVNVVVPYKNQPMSIFDAVKQGIPLLSFVMASPDKGRITVCVPAINHIYSPDYVGSIFEQKSITIGKQCGYFSFTKIEALSDAITLKQKVEQKSYVGVYKHTTVLPTSVIEEVSLVTNEDKWYTDINNMLVDYQKGSKT